MGYRPMNGGRTPLPLRRNASSVFDRFMRHNKAPEVTDRGQTRGKFSYIPFRALSLLFFKDFIRAERPPLAGTRISRSSSNVVNPFFSLEPISSTVPTMKRGFDLSRRYIRMM